MSSFMSLGFGFEAKDKGLLSFQQQVSSGFTNLNSQINNLNVASNNLSGTLGGMGAVASGVANIGTNAQNSGASVTNFSKTVSTRFKMVRGAVHFTWLSFKHFMDAVVGAGKLAIDFGKLMAGAVFEKAKRVGDAFATSQENLTTSLEGLIVQSHKAAKAQAANYGIANEELRKYAARATAMHLSQNTSVEESTAALVAHARAGKALAAAGLTSANLTAQSTSVYGFSSIQLADNLQRAEKTLRMSSEEAGRFASVMFHAGKQVGNVNMSMSSMGSIVELANQRLRTFGGDQQAANIRGFTDDMSILMQMFRKTGLSAEDSINTTTAFASTLVKSRQSFQDLFAGVGSDLDALQKHTAIGTGQFTAMMKNMEQGPVEFIKGLVQIRENLKGDKHSIEAFSKFFNSHMIQAFGSAEVAGKLMAALEGTSSKALEGIKATAEDIGKTTRKAYESGRTLQDRFELKLNTFMMKFRDVGREASKEFVKNFGGAAKDTIVSMKQMVEAGGLAGDIIGKLSEMHQFGIFALLPKALQGPAAVAQTMFKQLSPALDILGKLGFSFRDLLSPLNLMVGLLTTFGFIAAKKGKRTGEVFKELTGWVNKGLDSIQNFTKNLPNLGNLIGEAITNFNTQGVGNGIGAKILTIFDHLWGFVKPIGLALAPILQSALQAAFKWVFAPERGWDKLFKRGLESLSAVFKGITTMTPTEAVEAIGRAFLASLKIAFVWAIKQVGSILWENKGTVALAIAGFFAAPWLFSAVKVGLLASLGGGMEAGLKAGMQQAFGSQAGGKISDKIIGLMDSVRLKLFEAGAGVAKGAGFVGRTMGNAMMQAALHPIRGLFVAQFALNLASEFSERFWDELHKKMQAPQGKESPFLTVAHQLSDSIVNSIPIVGGAINQMIGKFNEWRDHANDTGAAVRKLLSPQASKEIMEEDYLKAFNDPAAGRNKLEDLRRKIGNKEYYRLFDLAQRRKEDAAAQMAMGPPNVAGNIAAQSVDRVKEEAAKAGSISGEAMAEEFTRKAKTPAAAKRMMQGMADAFKEGTKFINDILNPFFTEKIAQFENFAKKIEEVVGRIRTSFMALNMTASANLASKPGATPTSTTPRSLEGVQEKWAQVLIQATDNPLWVETHMPFLETQMATLIAEVRNLKGTVGGRDARGRSTGERPEEPQNVNEEKPR